MTVQQDYSFPYQKIRQFLVVFFVVVVVVVVLAPVLTSCTAPPVQPRQKPPAPAMEQPSETDVRLDTLRRQAERAMNLKRLTTPLDDNAYYRYLQMLSIDPNNADAQIGLTRIVETYLNWSIDAIHTGQLRRATNMLNKARSVDPDHPDITALAARIHNAQKSERTVFELDQSAVTNKTQQLVGRLHEIGRIAEQRDARVTIRARSDREGRWIYQQLNDGSINRIRATVSLGQPPSVQLTHP